MSSSANVKEEIPSKFLKGWGWCYFVLSRLVVLSCLVLCCLASSLSCIMFVLSCIEWRDRGVRLFLFSVPLIYLCFVSILSFVSSRFLSACLVSFCLSLIINYVFPCLHNLFCLCFTGVVPPMPATSRGEQSRFYLHPKVWMSCLVLSCLVLSCLVLSCLVLSCLVLSCLAISCLVRSGLCIRLV